ncbi:uncharacterized protein LOC143029296 [Oratosquilla oratoria]|uniref:uncharacterized protein LOC143029296 n=1 Tax=Oratosquilla oratoria TaxID=337810 RepID=UPI003F772B93
MADSENCDNDLSLNLPEISDCVTDVFMLDGLDFMLDGQQLDQPQAVMSELAQVSSTDIHTDNAGVEESKNNALFAEHAVDLLGMNQMTTNETADSTQSDTINSTGDEVPLWNEALDFIMQNGSGCSKKNEFQILQPFDVDSIDENNQGTPASVVLDTIDCPTHTVVLNVNAPGSSNVKPTIPHQVVPILPKDPSHSNGNYRGKQRQRKKLKAYELPEFNDKEREKKRLNAVNARINRLRKKEEMEELRESLEKAIAEKNYYKEELKMLKETNNELEKRLKIIEEAVKFKC